ncbi:MAG TPA: hypothetical protein VHO66_06335 [Ruminiclostridium sp.]|nr:hypothetical protein [Ruminiclostridium sp.]
MAQNRASVIVNRTSEGLSVIDINIFSEYGAKHDQKLRQIIDGLNALPGLTVQDIRNVISNQFKIPQGSIMVND